MTLTFLSVFREHTSIFPVGEQGICRIKKEVESVFSDGLMCVASDAT